MPIIKSKLIEFNTAQLIVSVKKCNESLYLFRLDMSSEKVNGFVCIVNLTLTNRVNKTSY